MSMASVRTFIKREIVLTVSVLAAAVSCIFVPPDAGYLEYFDLRTLALLFCLMTVVAGLREAGVFDRLAFVLCRRAAGVRALGTLLILLSFFTSMLITNDVALLTFVPFAAVVLGLAGRREALLRVVVLQTAAANLGSMLTPVGNPQNLYLYSRYDMALPAFFRATLPLWAASLLMLLAACLLLPRRELENTAEEAPDWQPRRAAVHFVLFGLCLLTVLRVLAWYWMLAGVAAVLLVLDRRALLRADMPLLFTFAAFFVFSGNLGRIGAVDSFLRRALEGRVYLVALLTSQAVSNVPAALLLSGFTQDAEALLQGVNVGGLGTPVASLASLISMKLYFRTEDARPGRYLLEFTILNLALLLLLSLVRTALLRI